MACWAGVRPQTLHKTHPEALRHPEQASRSSLGRVGAAPKRPTDRASQVQESSVRGQSKFELLLVGLGLLITDGHKAENPRPEASDGGIRADDVSVDERPRWSGPPRLALSLPGRGPEPARPRGLTARDAIVLRR